MSHPSINRWGSNTFWKALWYSDISYSANLKQDLFFEKLVKTYLRYGIDTTPLAFVKPFWYQLNQKFITERSKRYALRYERPYTQWDKMAEEYIHAIARKGQDTFYLMRLWILKFSNWVLINLYWFQPLKKKSKRRVYRHDRVFFYPPSTPQTPLIRRLKFLISTKLLNLWEPRINYRF